ncbi:leucine-rich repeat domain-containing protein [Skeletonema marinoi]|uniref:Leucine-rich repeat domain-containing protein n=1 Tax=Skeletonema marinoi TaxID=267567 RepID=A0AAD9DFB3_9STRA|nr:leucine-rich repeat domain-containing protein [Skeletonema marinoi]
MSLRLASLGIPDAATLNPRLTSHLVLNLDNCPYIDWIWKKGSDNEDIARKWCSRDGKVDFPKDITNDELELFISRGYLHGTKRASFARCRKLTVEWFELFIEVSLPNSITDNELKKATRYLKGVDRLNCIGSSALKNYKYLGELSNLRELHFLHNKHLKSLTFLGIPLRTLIIGTRLEISGLGLLQLSHMQSLEYLALERGAGESLTDNILKVLCGLTKLRKLRITHCEKLTDKGLSSLQHLPQLSCIELRGSNFTDEGARQISKVKGLKQLSLIGWEQLTDKGLYYLSKIKSLESLDLRYASQITDSGLEQLRRLKVLRDLQLAECSVTSKGRARLSKNGVRVKVG